jgi:ankyrin repeat protein
VLQNGDTPLHDAAFKGHLVVVEQLLAAGAAASYINNVRPHVIDWLGKLAADA